MASKKHKASSSARSSSLSETPPEYSDSFKLLDKEVVAHYKHKVKGRSFIEERGISTYHSMPSSPSSILTMIEQRKWNEFVKPPNKGVAPIVREFYANGESKRVKGSKKLGSSVKDSVNQLAQKMENQSQHVQHVEKQLQYFEGNMYNFMNQFQPLMVQMFTQMAIQSGIEPLHFPPPPQYQAYPSFYIAVRNEAQVQEQAQAEQGHLGDDEQVLRDQAMEEAEEEDDESTKDDESTGDDESTDDVED